MMNLPGEKKYAILTTPGEAETGSAGEQPVKEYPGTAHRDDVSGMGSSITPHPPIHIGSKADDALKNAKEFRYCRTVRTTLKFLGKVLFPMRQYNISDTFTFGTEGCS